MSQITLVCSLSFFSVTQSMFSIYLSNYKATMIMDIIFGNIIYYSEIFLHRPNYIYLISCYHFTNDFTWLGFLCWHHGAANGIGDCMREDLDELWFVNMITHCRTRGWFIMYLDLVFSFFHCQGKAIERKITENSLFQKFPLLILVNFQFIVNLFHTFKMSIFCNRL